MEYPVKLLGGQVMLQANLHAVKVGEQETYLTPPQISVLNAWKEIEQFDGEDQLSLYYRLIVSFRTDESLVRPNYRNSDFYLRYSANTSFVVNIETGKVTQNSDWFAKRDNWHIILDNDKKVTDALFTKINDSCNVIITDFLLGVNFSEHMQKMRMDLIERLTKNFEDHQKDLLEQAKKAGNKAAYYRAL